VMIVMTIPRKRRTRSRCIVLRAGSSLGGRRSLRIGVWGNSWLVHPRELLVCAAIVLQCDVSVVFDAK
jgi:hypothetical protein